MTPQELSEAFATLFGRRPAGMAAAPGRVNLIGEHTDYNDGFVLPIAIERRTLAAWAPREDGRMVLASRQQPGKEVQLDLCEELVPGEPKWANYPRGVIAMLQRAGMEMVPCDLLFDSDVPIGSGLSSSASLEMATAIALLAAADRTVDRYDLAKLCQAAEHEFAGTPCGIMDQAISALGRAGHALLLDCRNGQTEQIPFDDPDAVLLVCNTEVQHELSDGGYAARRQQCFEAAAKLGVASLRDIDEDALLAGRSLLSDVEFRRARHVVGEIARTCSAVDRLRVGEMKTFGELMYASHESLRDDYEVSCEELDTVVKLARLQEGVHGARMTGGGFGGCAIVLAEAGRADDIGAAIREGFDARFGRACPIYPTTAAAGATVLE